MRDKPADITHRYEQAVRDAFASDFVHVCADVEWSFLAQEAGEFLVKPPVVRREALVCYLCAGQVHPNSRCSEWRKTLECPDLPRRSEDEDVKMVCQVPEFRELKALRYMNLIVKQGTVLRHETTHQHR